MLDHASLLTRFVGHRVCVTLYGQNKVWGRVATVCHDSVRLIDTAVVSDVDDQEWLNQSLFEDSAESGRPRFAETVIQLNHIVSVTCLEENLDPPEDDEPPRLEPSLRAEPSPSARTRTFLSRRTLESEIHETQIEAYADHFLGSDRLAIELGYGLLKLVDPEEDDDLLDRIENLRKTLAAETGLWLPPVHVRDSLRLGQHEYRILVCGQEVARGELFLDYWFSIDPDIAWEELPSQPAGEGARWISADQVDDETLQGRIVVEPSAVVVGRLHSVALSHADDLLSLDDVRRLLDRARAVAPALIEELNAHGLPLGTLRRILSQLLAERVPLRGFLRILESLVSVQRLGMRDVDELIARVRVDLGRELCSGFANDRGHLPAILLDAALEQHLWRSVRGHRLVLAPTVLQTLAQKLTHLWRAGHRRVPLVVDGALRKPLREALARLMPGLHVLACTEIPHRLSVIPLGIIRHDELPATADDVPGWSALLAHPVPVVPEAARFAAPERRPLREAVPNVT